MKFLDYLLLERNIINLDTVDTLIDDVLKDLHDATAVVEISSENLKKMEKWIKTNFKNFILRDYEPLTKLSPTDSYVTNRAKKEKWIQKAIDRGDELNALIVTHYLKDDLAHVIDYFLANQNVNISRMSVPEAIRQSKEWTLAFNRKEAGEDDPNGIKDIRKYPDGFKWVKITSEQAARREGILMHHSILTSCWPYIESGQSTAYSLRDKKNEPHCTVEVRGNELIQMRGNSNLEVKDKYRKYCKDFIMKPITGSSWSSVATSTMEEFQLVALRGKFYDATNMSSSEKKILVDELMFYMFERGSAYDKRWAITVLGSLDLYKIFSKTIDPSSIIYAAGGVDKSVQDKIREMLSKQKIFYLVDYYNEYYKDYSRTW